MKYTGLFVLTITSMSLLAQSPKDSILLRERSIDRPITLHKGQLRIEGGYGLSAITKRFDDGGDVIKLRDEGISYLRHNWYLDLRYGILENLHFGVATNYKRQSQRIQQVLTVSNVEFTELFEIQNKTGLEDLLLSLTARAPLRNKAIDLILTGGVYVPLGPTKPDKPNHSIEEEVPSPGVMFRYITYDYSSQWGSGTAVGTLGGIVKFRGKNSAITGSVNFDYSLGESESVRWQHQLVNSNFEYQSQRYIYQAPNRVSFGLEFERQLSSWFDLSLMVQGEKLTGGWDEFSGVKVARADVEFFSVSPGYEILVTPKIWLRQRLFVSVLGKNTEAPFTINTSLVYNFFPFN